MNERPLSEMLTRSSDSPGHASTAGDVAQEWEVDAGYRDRYGTLVTAYGGQITHRLADEFFQIATDYALEEIEASVLKCRRARLRCFPSNIRNYLPDYRPVQAPKPAPPRPVGLLGEPGRATESWMLVQQGLADSLHPHNFDAWIAPAKALGFSLSGASRALVVQCPSDLSRSWLDERLRTVVERQVRRVCGDETGVQFVVQPSDGEFLALQLQ